MQAEGFGSFMSFYKENEGLKAVKFKSNKWFQLDSSPNPLNFDLIKLNIKEVNCEIFVEKNSGIVLEIDLSVKYDI